MTRIVSCDRCKYQDFEYGNSFTDIKVVCKKEKRDLDSIPDDKYEEEMKKEIECGDFKSRYIEYPIEVSEIKRPDDKAIRTQTYNGKCGQLVKIRPCNEKYGNKTYLGIFLGDADVGFFINHNSENKELSISRHYNPAIFVPELKEIIYGMESWWGKIHSEEELNEITNDDIDNVWYVRLLKGNQEENAK